MNYKVFNDILNIYENEIRKNTKNKSKIYNFEKYKFENINNIYNIIVNYNNNYTFFISINSFFSTFKKFFHCIKVNDIIIFYIYFKKIFFLFFQYIV